MRLSGLRFYLYSRLSVEAEIGRYYETPDYISHSDTKKRSDELGVSLGARLYAETQGPSGGT